MKDGRRIQRWIGQDFPPPFRKSILRTNDSLSSELFGHIDLYGEIKDLGVGLVNRFNHQNPEESFSRFQAYTRQAKTFYRAAQELHHRASPLLYYYSFMNFAKAHIFIRTPGFSDTYLRHGLSQNVQRSGLVEQNIVNRADGVFPRFYELISREKMDDGARLKIVDLLGYTSDVLYEYRFLGFGSHASFRCKFIIALTGEPAVAYPVIAVFGGKTPKFDRIKQALDKNFEEVDIPALTVREIFDMSAEVRAGIRFFEGKSTVPTLENGNVPTLQIISETVSALGSMISYVPYNDGTLFALNDQIETPKLTAMNEVLAIYCCMYFFGSLIRYRPDYLESLLATRDAWLIERFVRQAPITFLRHFRNLLTDEYVALEAQ